MELHTKIENLENFIRSLEKVIVGFSGGVDSTLVSFIANKALGKNALIVLAKTETILQEDIDLARLISKKFNFNYMEIKYNELDIENYASNPVNRCYFCKSELYSRLEKIAINQNIKFILDGANLDDLGDYRPGRLAAKEKQILSPLIICKFTKSDVREAAKILGLPNHDKPAAPCLSSRIPYGMPINQKSLDMIAEGERFIRQFGFKNVRVRHYGEKAKIEVDKHLVHKLFEMKSLLFQKFNEIGYKEVEIDPEGFSSGKLNKNIIEKIEIKR